MSHAGTHRTRQDTPHHFALTQTPTHTRDHALITITTPIRWVRGAVASESFQAKRAPFEAFWPGNGAPVPFTSQEHGCQCTTDGLISARAVKTRGWHAGAVFIYHPLMQLLSSLRALQGDNSASSVNTLTTGSNTAQGTLCRVHPHL